MLEGGAFGGDEVMRMEPHDGISAFVKWTPECSLTLSTSQGLQEKILLYSWEEDSPGPTCASPLISGAQAPGL